MEQEKHLDRVEGGMEEFLRWSANVCDPNARIDLTSTENQLSFR